MRVQIEEATPDPEMVVLRAARNDYRHEFVGNATNDELLAEIEEDGEDPDETLSNFLIRLMKHGHFGPFEHPTITFGIEGISRTCMAQLTRHRTGITFDIRSQRYVDFEGSDAEDLLVTPLSVSDVRAPNRNPDAKTLGELLAEYDGWDEGDLQGAREDVFELVTNLSLWGYDELRELGVPPEDARFVLPLASKVNMVVSMNARALLHIADMRAQADSQWEIAQLAGEMLDLAEEWMPATFSFYRSEMIHRKNRLAP